MGLFNKKPTPPVYPPEVLDEYNEDNGTMPDNVETLKNAVIGHRIVSAKTERVDRGSWYGNTEALVITLDNGKRVILADTDDCCAYTTLNSFLLQPDAVDHVILGVGTTGQYTKWHIYADFGDIMELEVGWSCGNPFYYGYGFDILVQDTEF